MFNMFTVFIFIIRFYFLRLFLLYYLNLLYRPFYLLL